MSLIMKTNNVRVLGIKRKTKAEMFKNLKVNDEIVFEVPIQRAGRGEGTYATNIKITNVSTEEYVFKTFNELPVILDVFELEEVER